MDVQRREITTTETEYGTERQNGEHQHGHTCQADGRSIESLRARALGITGLLQAMVPVGGQIVGAAMMHPLLQALRIAVAQAHPAEETRADRRANAKRVLRAVQEDQRAHTT